MKGLLTRALLCTSAITLFSASAQAHNSTAQVYLLGVSDQLTLDRSNHWSTIYGRGTQLSYDRQGNYNYTASDGTTIAFVPQKFGVVPLGRAAPVYYFAGLITKPTGQKTTYTYYTGTYTNCVAHCTPGYPGSTVQYISRVSAISNNSGYAIKIDYAANSFSLTGQQAFSTGVGVSALNTISDLGCNLAGVTSCATSATRNVGYAPTTITDPLGNTTTYSFDGSGRLSSIQLPLSSMPDVTVTYDSGSGRVTKVARPAGTWLYAWTANGNGQVTAANITIGPCKRFGFISAG